MKKTQQQKLTIFIRRVSIFTDENPHKKRMEGAKNGSLKEGLHYLDYPLGGGKFKQISSSCAVDWFKFKQHLWNLGIVVKLFAFLKLHDALDH